MHLGPRKRNARLREMRDEFAGAYQEQENILRMDEWWRIFVTVSGMAETFCRNTQGCVILLNTSDMSGAV